MFPLCRPHNLHIILLIYSFKVTSIRDILKRKTYDDLSTEGMQPDGFARKHTPSQQVDTTEHTRKAVWVFTLQRQITVIAETLHSLQSETSSVQNASWLVK